MKSVGEAMAIGRTFAESLQKALRSLETGLDGLDEIEIDGLGRQATPARKRCCVRSARPADAGPPARRRAGAAAGHERRRRSTQLCHIRPVVPANQLADIVALERRCARTACRDDAGNFRASSRPPASRTDARLAHAGRAARRPTCRTARGKTWGCGRSSSASTPALPSSPRRRPTCTRPMRRPSRARTADEARPSRRAKKSPSSAAARTASARASSSIIAAATPRSPCADAGFETIMVNCNPETVSTDYDTSDRLYFEPLTAEGRARDHCWPGGRGRHAEGRRSSSSAGRRR